MRIARNIREFLESEVEAVPDAFAREYLESSADSRAQQLADLLDDCTEDEWDWDGLDRIAQRLLRADGEQLPPALRVWIADRLNGKCRRPAARGNNPNAHYLRNHIIVLCVRMLKEKGLPATRNRQRARECCELGGSGCDVLGVVFSEENLSFEGVAKIWRDGSKSADVLFTGLMLRAVRRK